MKKKLMLILCLLLIALSAHAEEVTLNILSGGEPGWEEQFMEEHPEIKVRHTAAEATGHAYLTLLMTNDEYDVYELSVGPIYEALKEKGYLLPIEGSETIDAFADGLYPYMQATLLKDHQIYAVPVPSEEEIIESLSWGVWSYAQALWQEENLGELPATYAELLTRMIEWEKSGSDTGYRLVAAYMGLDGFVSAVFRAYVRQYEKENGAISFDTLIFREVMPLLKEYGDLSEPRDDRQALVIPYGEYLANCAETGYVWITPPAFEENQTAPIDANASIYVVNARTRHKEAAIAYAEAAVRSLNEPSLLMMTNQEAKEIKQGKRIAITKEQAEQVKSFIPLIQFDQKSMFLGDEHFYDMEEMLQQYIQGELSLDMLIEQLNRRTEMAVKELLRG